MLQIPRFLIAVLFHVVISISIADAQLGPQFQTWVDNSNFHQPAYPLIFVASYRDPSINNGGNFGTDVLEAGSPSRGQELWMLLADGTTEQLFPIVGVHDEIVDYPLGPTNGRINGSVTEPSISIDGRRVYFSYFHDALNFPPFCCNSTGHSNFDGWPLGGDIYAIDLGPKIDDPSFPADQLTVSRLTQTADWYDDAMNPSVSAQTESDKGGVVYIGAVEVDLEFGRKLIFASNRKQLKNSNPGQHKKNKNFNLFSADILEGDPLSIKNINQYQYYTTTSALSPNRLRVGMAFSYQATTEEARQWQIQQLIGNKWTPLYGYGIVAEAAHLGTFCVKSGNGTLPRGDFEVMTQYYNANNNGFGFIAAQDMSQVGLNTYNHNSGAGVGILPKQVGSYNLSPGVKKGDYPSPVGKYTTPACGGPDELFLSYDPGIANHRNSPHRYHPQIVMTDLEPGNPGNSGAHLPVVVSPDPLWGALWPKPLIDWKYRLSGSPHPNGNAKQKKPASVIDKNTTITAGMPHAILGTSALYNTDITPVDCKDSQGYYNPYENGNTIDQIFKNVESLSQVIVDGPGDINQQTGSCTPPSETDIFGVSVYMTSNKINDNTNNPGYVTEGGKSKESKRLLGTFEVGMEGQSDTSFKAVIPANTPVEFHLIANNGLKLADVRSWHSLKPRETRVDCGGCHNHRAGESIPWSSSSSSDPNLPALDMVGQTTHISYNAMCQPVLQSSPEAAREVPVWQDLSMQFDQYCSSCHTNNGGNQTQSALNAFNYDSAKLNSLVSGSPVREMFNKKYIDKFSANGSRAFWAAYGQRTDGRDNSWSQYQPNPSDYSACSNGNINLVSCGYKFDNVHAGLGLCDGSNPAAADWVYQFGYWIDNHAPIDTGSSYAYDYDRYHPTIDGALAGGADCLHPNWFNIGYWDDSGTLAELNIEVNGVTRQNITDPNQLTNGRYRLNLGGADLSPLLPILVKVSAVDAAGNTQHYEKSVKELVQQCIAAGGQLTAPSEPINSRVHQVNIR